MVNNGASRACHACKQKRKKCDETNPSCLRCTRARRKCPGYQLSRDRRFINYAGEAKSSLLIQPSGSTQLDLLDWPRIEHDARAAFFDDYCIVSPNQDLSRGYLHGLQTMIARAGPGSELAQACTIISLANLGKKLRSSLHVERANGLYALLLRSFRLKISNEAMFTTVESLITASLLGLYEIVTSTEAYPGAYVAHARGVSAILVSKISPFDLICGGKFFQVSSPTPLEDLQAGGSENPIPGAVPPKILSKVSPKFSVLCTPYYQSGTNIDMVFAQTEPLIRRAGVLLQSDATLDQVRQLKLDAERLKDAYDAWPETIPEEWTPRSMGVIMPKDDGISPNVGYWPGNISSYRDNYIASIRNGHRKASLLVLNVIIACHRRLNTCPDSLEVENLTSEVTAHTQGIVSSIPYLLASDPWAFAEHAAAARSGAGEPHLVPGRPIGGLLSMYALYILSTLPIVDAKVQVYARGCLAWIGTRMGIGHATILSQRAAIDFEYSNEAHVIIWSGMLI